MLNGRARQLALGTVAASALAASAAQALQFNDGDLIVVLTKNNIDAIYDFGGILTPGTTKQFTLPTGTQGFPAGPSGALSEGAVANVVGVPQPGLQQVDGNFGMVPVGTLLFSTKVSNPKTQLTDTAISNANTFLESTPAPSASGWLATLSGFVNPISSSPNSLILPTSRNGTYSSSTGPGNNGQDAIAGSLPFKTSATVGAGGSLSLPLFFASQGYQSVGGTIPTVVTQDGSLKFSESAGILTVTLLAVPEPGTLVLLAAGLLGIAGVGRTRGAKGSA